MADNKFNIDLSGNGSNNHNHNHNGLLNGQAESKGPDFEQLFYIVWGYKWIILAFMIVCVGFAYWYAQRQPTIYKSSGTILISNSQATYQFPGNGLGALLTSKYGVGLTGSFADQLTILRSRTLSKEIADTLMDIKWMKNGKLYPVLYQSYPDDSTIIKSKKAVAARVSGGLSFTKGSNENNTQNEAEISHLITVSFTSPSPLEAQSVVNLTIGQYIKYTIKRNRFAANAAVDFLEKQLKKRKNEMQRATHELQAYMQKIIWCRLVAKPIR